MSIPYLLSALVLALLLWLANGVRRIGAVSTGASIPARSGAALLLVDLQKVFWDDGPYAEADKARAQEAILAEVRKAKASGHPIIAVRQEWSIPSTKVIAKLTMKGQALTGTAGTELATPFADVADHVLVKRVQDAFETGYLDDLLGRLDVGVLRIVGLDFNYCVLKTALAAKSRGYDVSIVSNGTLAAASTEDARTTLQGQRVTLT